MLLPSTLSSVFPPKKQPPPAAFSGGGGAGAGAGGGGPGGGGGGGAGAGAAVDGGAGVGRGRIDSAAVHMETAQVHKPLCLLNDCLRLLNGCLRLLIGCWHARATRTYTTAFVCRRTWPSRRCRRPVRKNPLRRTSTRRRWLRTRARARYWRRRRRHDIELHSCHCPALRTATCQTPPIHAATPPTDLAQDRRSSMLPPPERERYLTPAKDGSGRFGWSSPARSASVPSKIEWKELEGGRYST